MNILWYQLIYTNNVRVGIVFMFLLTLVLLNAFWEDFHFQWFIFLGNVLVEKMVLGQRKMEENSRVRGTSILKKLYFKEFYTVDFKQSGNHTQKIFKKENSFFSHIKLITLLSVTAKIILLEFLQIRTFLWHYVILICEFNHRSYSTVRKVNRFIFKGLRVRSHWFHLKRFQTYNFF